MVNIVEFSDRFQKYINLQLDNMAKNTPVVGLAKPIVSRMINKNFDKVHQFMSALSDKDGNIDIEGIMNEMMEKIKEPQIFSVDIPLLHTVEIGNGNIVFTLPFINKRILLNMNDLELLRDSLIGK